MSLVFLSDHQTSQLCPNAWLCFPMHQEEMERLIALQLWLHQQWIGDDRWDVGFGIHMISEIPCACWWAWQCFFPSFYTQNSPLLIYLRADKDNYSMCMYTLLLFFKKPLRYFLLFFHSCLPPESSAAHPGETLFMLRACIVWVLARAQGLGQEGGSSWVRSAAVALGWGQSAKKEQRDNSSVSGC